MGVGRRFELFGAVGLACLPWPLRRWVMNRFLGHDIARTARIGFSFLTVGRIEMAEKSRIGHLNTINLDVMQIGTDAKIGNLNRIGGIRARQIDHFVGEIGRQAKFTLSGHSSITSRHFIDCCNSVDIGEFTTLAGTACQILTHGIDIRTNRQRSGPVRIGRYCMIGTSTVIIKGAVLPDFSVLGASSMLQGKHDKTHMIYSGVPAMPVKAIDPEAAYFSRTETRVG